MSSDACVIWRCAKAIYRHVMCLLFLREEGHDRITMLYRVGFHREKNLPWLGDVRDYSPV